MKKWILVVGGILVVLIIAISTYIYIFLKSPKYSLYQLGLAYKTHNLQLAKQFIDIDAISQQVGDEIENVIRKQSNQPSTAINEWEKMGEEFGKTIIENYIPSLKKQAIDQTKKAYIQAIEGDNSNVKNAINLNALDLRSLILPIDSLEVKTDGAMRLVTIPTQDNKVIIYRMRNENGKWKIVAWDNLASMIDSSEYDKAPIQQEETKRVHLGERIDLADGWYLTVNTPSSYSPNNSYDLPDIGNKLMAIEVTYENGGVSEGSYDPSNFELKDQENHRYKREYSGKKPMLEYGTLPSKDKVNGFITYEIPNSATPSAVIYSSIAGGTLVFE